MAYKGKYKVKNKNKYVGNFNNVTYRSLWERKFMVYCDENSNILEWSSEEIIIPYISPIDNKSHRYYPDFYIKIKDKNNIIKKMLIEIKPSKEVDKPKKKQNTRQYMSEVFKWNINTTKWEYAKEFCENKGWYFQIITEKELGIK